MWKLAAIVLEFGSVGLAAYGVYRAWVRAKWWEALCLVAAALALLVIGVEVFGPTHYEGLPLVVMSLRDHSLDWEFASLWTAAAYATAVVLLVGWVWKFYAAWVLGRVRGDEGLAGKRGVRAWLGPVNALMMGVFVVSAWAGFGWAMWWTAVVGVAALLAYPVMRGGVAGDGGARADGGHLSEERRRVLAMVEMGKISGEDGAELIGALRGAGGGMGSRAGTAGRGSQRVMGIGACLLAAGFFLPWFRITINSTALRELAIDIGLPLDVKYGSGIVLAVHGGGVAHGLGWAALGMGLGAALLPLIWRGPDESGGRRGLMLGALCVGTVVMLYVMSLGMSVSAEGLWMAAAGYGVIWAGAVRGLSGMGAGAQAWLWVEVEAGRRGC